MKIVYVVSSKGHFGSISSGERERVFSKTAMTFCWGMDESL